MSSNASLTGSNPGYTPDAVDSRRLELKPAGTGLSCIWDTVGSSSGVQVSVFPGDVYQAQVSKSESGLAGQAQTVGGLGDKAVVITSDRGGHLVTLTSDLTLVLEVDAFDPLDPVKMGEALQTLATIALGKID